MIKQQRHILETGNVSSFSCNECSFPDCVPKRVPRRLWKKETRLKDDGRPRCPVIS